MTDNEIIQALDYCNRLSLGYCNSFCPMFYNGTSSKQECMKKMCRSAFDLINRQKAEIEQLRKNNKAMMQTMADVHTEAIEEFAERLKEVGIPVTGERGYEGVFVMATNIQIDNLVKEMEKKWLVKNDETTLG